MRTALKVTAKVVIAIGAVGAGISFVALFVDGQSAMASNALALAASLGITIGAGVLWMLAEISEQLGELPEDLVEFQRSRTGADVAA